MSTLEVSSVRKVFGVRGRRKLLAVDDVSFTLRSGTTVALVGESGSGKSTVARILALLTRPTSGRVLLDGAEIAAGRRAVARYRHGVQMVFQDPFGSLNPSHTIGYHLRRPLQLHHVLPPGVSAEQGVAELLTRVNLGPADVVAARYPHELSGGQRQRVAIARALAPRPKVLLADEPVSMLDVSIRLEILELLDRAKVADDLAVLYITHDLATARYFATSIMVMYRGQIVESGPADDVIVRPSHPYTQLLARSAPDPESRYSPRGAMTDALPDPDAVAGDTVAPGPVRRASGTIAQDGTDPGCLFRDRCPFVMEICSRQRPPMIEVRPGHTAKCWLLDESRPPADLTSSRPDLIPT
jgi:peptide/nickel transport system ATP-binding protein